MELKRELRFFDVLCLGINAIIGSGIFLFPGIMMQQVGPASIFAFLGTGVLLIPVALCFAQLSARVRATGGPCLYAEEAFGPWAGFGVGWICWITNIFSFAAVANAVSSYMGHFWAPLGSIVATKLIAAVVILALGILNYRGVKPAARTTDFFTILKIIPLALFVIVGFFYIDPSRFVPLAPNGFGSMGSALFLAFFAFQGFEVVPVLAGESKNPERDMPRATLASLLGVLFFYMLIQAVAVGTFPGLSGSEKPLSEAASTFMGPLAAVVALGAIISTVGFTTGAALGGPRYLYALGGTHCFPKSILGVHSRFATPHVAIAIHTLIVLIVAMGIDFIRLVDLANIAVGIQYITACACAWKILKKPFLPILGMVIVLWLSSQAQTEEIITGVAVIGFGYVLAFLYIYFKRSGGASDVKGSVEK